MSDSERQESWLKPELAHELGETVATLGRLGATLVSLPTVWLTPSRREQARQLAGEVRRIGAALPRAVGAAIGDAADEWESGEKRREDLGSRLRRERQQGSWAAHANGGPREDEELEGEEEATEEVEEDIQEAWDTPPAPPDEVTD